MNKSLSIFLVFFLIGVSFLSGCGTAVTRWEQLYQSEDPAAQPQNTEDNSSDELIVKETVEDTQEKEEKNEPEKESICVYICGAVVNDGVYELPKGSRVVHVIEAAGGLSEEADTLLINQAKIVEDGEQIRIYTKDEAQQIELEVNADSEESVAIKVNINTADKDRLMTLPGIGESKAEAIIAYRTEQGAFQKVEDIMNIAGIKEAVFSKIKDKITV